MRSLLKRIIRQRGHHKKGGIQKVKILKFTVSICRRVVMVKIFKNGSGGKNFGFFKILVFVECRTHRQVQQEEQKQNVLNSGVPSYH